MNSVALSLEQWCYLQDPAKRFSLREILIANDTPLGLDNAIALADKLRDLGWRSRKDSTGATLWSRK